MVVAILCSHFLRCLRKRKESWPLTDAGIIIPRGASIFIYCLSTNKTLWSVILEDTNIFRCVSISINPKFRDWHNETLSFVWLFYDFVWLFMIIYEYTCLCMNMYDYVWLCLTMYDYIWQVLPQTCKKGTWEPSSRTFLE